MLTATVPLGNLSYYFKTKEAIGTAIVDGLAGAYESLRSSWESTSDPRDRLEAFVQMTFENREMLAERGCPVGTLCAELHKDAGPLAEQAARSSPSPFMIRGTSSASRRI